MTFFEFFHAALSAVLTIDPEQENYFLDGHSGLDDDEALGVLGNAEDALRQLLATENIEKLREPSVDTAVLILGLVHRLAESNVLTQGQAARAVVAIALANNLTDHYWDLEWDDEDRLISLSSIPEGSLDALYTPPPGLRRLRWFFHEPSVGLDKAIGLLDFRGISSLDGLASVDHDGDWLEEILEDAEVNSAPMLLVNTIAALLSYDGDVIGECVAASAIDHELMRLSFLKYQVVLQGNLLTPPVPTQRPRHLDTIFDSIAPIATQAQYSEPYAMLAEINSRTTMVEAFLSTYHVLENYMIRAAIANTFRGTVNNGLAKTRDIKRLSKSLDENEKKHLKNLFEKSWLLQIGGSSLKDFAEETMRTLKESYIAEADDRSAFDDWMVKFDCKLRHTDLHLPLSNEAKANFTSLVYGIRNAIVHNKETELHLSNRELSDPICKVILSELCIPIMQRLAFGLPSIESADGPPHVQNPIEYKTQNLSLF